MKIVAVILAAGKGRRMCSNIPKVLQPLGGRPLLLHVLEQLQTLKLFQQVVVVVAPGATAVEALCQDYSQQRHMHVQCAIQNEALGTADALRAAMPLVGEATQLLVMNADMPLMQAGTVLSLLQNTQAGSLGLLTAVVPQPKGLGRVLRATDGKVLAIREERDASAAERQITEINTGTYVFPVPFIWQALQQIKNDNAQGECYLTDVLALAVQQQVAVQAQMVPQADEALGVNDLYELAMVERAYQERLARQYALQGVYIYDPKRLQILGDPREISLAAGVYIGASVVLEGKIQLAAGVRLEGDIYLKDCILAAGVVVKPFSVLEGVEAAATAVIGPFARLRPHSQIGVGARIGNFVEIKQASIGAASKINHLSYIGDAQLGAVVNVGAGTITCNYDGKQKHQTIIEDKVHIGAGSQLVAPVRVGQGATLGAGTTLLHDAAPGQLVVNTKQMRIIKDWQRPGQQAEEEK
jgi:bifunctional UDP-N-acetylglucosamine pyrophosphorylase/glucosamine-1-phosphate N-acetyltransferase